jgi:hypothetical protein
MNEDKKFMVFELDDLGEKKRVEVTKGDLPSFLLLHPEQIYVIIREDLRKIFIWKGPKSTTRDKLISTRTTIALQEELREEFRLHPCKVISVDVGDEPLEFLSAFNLPNTGNAYRQIMRMMGEPRQLSLTREVLPKVFAPDLIENSKDDELPTFTPYVIQYFESCGITVKVQKAKILFFGEVVKHKIF